MHESALQAAATEAEANRVEQMEYHAAQMAAKEMMAVAKQQINMQQELQRVNRNALLELGLCEGEWHEMRAAEVVGLEDEALAEDEESAFEQAERMVEATQEAAETLTEALAAQQERDDAALAKAAAKQEEHEQAATERLLETSKQASRRGAAMERRGACAATRTLTPAVRRPLATGATGRAGAHAERSLPCSCTRAAGRHFGGHCQPTCAAIRGPPRRCTAQLGPPCLRRCHAPL